MNALEVRDLAKSFGLVWTPGLLWLTPEGRMCHRNVGFFEPEEFLAESLFGCGQVAAGQSDWERARATFQETVDRWPRSHAAPAALYWAGVAAMKVGQKDDMVRSWKKILSDHPESAWAMKVSFIQKSK